MQIAGFIKNSFVDYPGHISAVVFAPSCNMACWYCHNSGLEEDKNNKYEDFLEYVKDRKDFLDGVVFSGGEVTLQKDLKQAMQMVKDLGLKVKLDTNGTHPEIIKDLVGSGVVDYIAMDIKAPPAKYESICGFGDMGKIKESISYIKSCGVDYEFRTTLSPDLLHADVREMAQLVRGAKRYVLQQYRTECRNRILLKKPHEPEYLRLAVDIASPYVKECFSRGI